MAKGLKLPIAPLFVPAHRPERFQKAAASGADAIILDLEDAVPAASRDQARQNIAQHGVQQVPVFVRVNAAATEDFARDMAALAGAAVDGIMLARAETPADIAAVHGHLRGVSILALVETAKAFGALGALLRSEGVAGAVIGTLDLAADLGCAPSRDALAMLRSMLVLEARLAGLPAPIEGVTPSIDDLALIESDGRYAAELGFGGKLAIHPKQVEPIRRAFLPDAATRAWAERVMAAAEAGGAVQIDGTMVDRPVVERARRLLAMPLA